MRGGETSEGEKAGGNVKRAAVIGSEKAGGNEKREAVIGGEKIEKQTWVIVGEKSPGTTSDMKRGGEASEGEKAGGNVKRASVIGGEKARGNKKRVAVIDGEKIEKQTCVVVGEKSPEKRDVWRCAVQDDGDGEKGIGRNKDERGGHYGEKHDGIEHDKISGQREEQKGDNDFNAKDERRELLTLSQDLDKQVKVVGEPENSFVSESMEVREEMKLTADSNGGQGVMMGRMGRNSGENDEEGWKTVNRKRSKIIKLAGAGGGSFSENRWRKIEENSVSVFVDKLPISMDKEWIGQLFGRTGRVIDVYLSRKKRRHNASPFAFVRYKYLEEARKAVERGNEI